jgi:hypothetical protein
MSDVGGENRPAMSPGSFGMAMGVGGAFAGMVWAVLAIPWHMNAVVAGVVGGLLIFIATLAIALRYRKRIREESQRAGQCRVSQRLRYPEGHPWGRSFVPIAASCQD